jgi:hypothetical protein
MSIKLKAFLQTAGIVGLALLVNALIQFINTYVSTETLVTAFEFSLIGLVLYSCYSLVLTRLEINEKYKELDK